MLLSELVALSRSLSATRSRSRKAELLAEILGSSGEEIRVVVGLLMGRPRQGRIGVGYASAFGTSVTNATDSSLTLAELDDALSRIASTQGSGSQGSRNELMSGLFARTTPEEQEFLQRVLTGEVRHGALEGLLLDGVIRATKVDADLLRRAAMLSGDLGEVAALALNEGEDALARIRLQPLRPILPMLAKTARDVTEAMEISGRASVEWKLDGLRLQAHREGEQVALFTRSLKDITDRLPEVVRVVAGLPVHSAVLDGEAISIQPDGRPAPFQETMSRATSETKPDAVPVLPFFFDVLHLDGSDLIDRPLHERWAALERIVPASHLVSRVVTDSADEAAEFLGEARRNRHEGVMVKGIDSLYEAGRRGARWLKVKPAHTLDLVVLAAEWGSGRREGWLSNLHLGARDPESGEFVMLGKTFKGLTDEMLRWQTDRFQEIEVRRTKRTVFVKPVVVVEIAFDGVLPSPRYPGGMSLRFARVKGYRPDKSAQEADTIETVRSIFGGRTQA